ncbi:hypothetical protein JCM8097_003485 [Rhodosporidiobolus ruineniae]
MASTAPAPAPGAGTPFSVQADGTVLDAEGKPCKPCTAFRSWAGAKKKKQPGDSSSSSSSSSGATSSAAASMAAFSAFSTASSPSSSSSSSSYPPPSAASSELPSDCPPDVERLGNHTWTFLHSTVSYFSPTPSAHQKSSMLSLLRALPTLYPCGDCAGHLGAYMKVNPPEAAVEKGRDSLEKWLCDVHNEVNERLGKEKFVCDNVAQRWRDGWKDGRCE